MVLATLAAAQEAPVLILTARVDQAEMLAARVGAYLPAGREPRLWDTPQSTPYEQLPFEHSAAAERVRILTSLAAGESPIIVASARNLMHLTIAPDDLAAMRRSFAVGDRLGSDDLLAWAANMGYQRVPLVFEPGAIAQRGGVIDLFPPDADHPVRLDLFGDEIESIRQFDAQSQRTRAVLPVLDLLPPVDLPVFRAGAAAAQLRKIDDRALRAEVRAEWAALIDRIEHGQLPAGIDLVAPAFGGMTSLIAHLFAGHTSSLRRSPIGLADYARDRGSC